MQLPFISKIDISGWANIFFFTLAYSCSIFFSYSWLTRHVVHEFPHLFMFCSGALGLLITMIIMRWRVWIPVKILLAVITSTFIVFIALSMLLTKEDLFTHQFSIWSNIQGLLLLPFILSMALKVYFSIPLVAIVYIFFKMRSMRMK